MASVSASVGPTAPVALRDRLEGAWRLLSSLPLLVQDAVLYAGSCGFALLNAGLAESPDYRDWGQMAAVAYGAATIVCLVGARRTGRRRPPATAAVTRLRRGVLFVLVLGVVVVPLGAELAWRAEATPGAHAQPEVAVIERAGDRAAAARSPYLTSPSSVGDSPQSDHHDVDSTAFFPYLPGMVLFGLPSAYVASAALGDARLALVLFTLGVAGGALLLGPGALRWRSRVVQVLVVLPFGALPMVTGGDDLPVLALCLLGLVLAARRRPVAAGLVLGVAGTLKFTAWPILLLLVFAVRDGEGRRAIGRYTLAAAVVALPVILLGVLTSPEGFLVNVVRFPLGLASVRSPAASPLLGQVLTTIFPSHRRLITGLLAAVGALLVLALLYRRPPRSVAGVAGVTAFALLLATLLAPATRFGYLIYPANLAAWAVALSVGAAQSGSFCSKSVRASVVSPAERSPFSAGVSEGPAGVSTTATSQ
ncbi:MAG TPA: glycosyltransferase 87 family protein [Acidimicrobiales bacterium]|nr:glycosyltransferase 87 family protein [Acidimicrobiales bacterium]